VVQLDRRLIDRLMFILVRIWRLMAMFFKLKLSLLESCSMDQFLQHYRDYGCGLVVRLNRRLVDLLIFVLEHI